LYAVTSQIGVCSLGTIDVIQVPEGPLRLTYNESQQSNNGKFYRPIQPETQPETFQLESDT
jgi:hypothetical protein